MHYPAFRDGVPDIAAFCSALRHEIKRFCLPRSHRQRTEQRIEQRPELRDELLAEDDDLARRLFIKAEKQLRRNGECGELLLYVILELLLSAPQVLSKMYLKTSDDVAVHGYDGVHAALHKPDNALVLYIGESKLYQSFAAGLGDALSDVKKRCKGDALRKEISLVKSHLDISDPSLREMVLRELDPYDKVANRVEKHAVLVGYSTDTLSSPVRVSEAEHAFIARMVDELHAAAAHLLTQVSALDLGHVNIELFLVPFASVQALRSAFYEAIGWKTPAA